MSPPRFSLSEPAPSRRDLAGSVMISLGWAFCTVVGLVLRPDPLGHGTHQRLGMPPCPSVLLFDRPCPGCGLTTSWTALLHGNLALAFRAHPLGPLLYLGYGAFAVGTLVLLARRRRWRDGPWVTRGFAMVFGVFLGFGLLRMALTPHYASSRERFLSAAMGR